MLDSIDFWKIGHIYTNHNAGKFNAIGFRRFRSMFGVSPSVCAILWKQLHRNLPDNAMPIHLMWALIFLKCYNSEEVNKAIINADEKTIRKWVWLFVDAIARLSIIKWNNRILDPTISNANVSIDGVDFSIYEPTPFNPKWYSHKLQGPGIRYEIGLGLKNGEIVWAYGGVPCGENSDLKLARDNFVEMLDVNEKAVADKGYNDKRFFITPSNTPHYPKIHILLARHETVNKRIKQFNILKNRFRHSLHRHPICFHAVINITQLSIINGEPLFSVE